MVYTYFILGECLSEYTKSAEREKEKKKQKNWNEETRTHIIHQQINKQTYIHTNRLTLVEAIKSDCISLVKEFRKVFYNLISFDRKKKQHFFQLLISVRLFLDIFIVSIRDLCNVQIVLGLMEYHKLNKIEYSSNTLINIEKLKQTEH